MGQWRTMQEEVKGSTDLAKKAAKGLRVYPQELRSTTDRAFSMKLNAGLHYQMENIARLLGWSKADLVQFFIETGISSFSFGFAEATGGLREDLSEEEMVDLAMVTIENIFDASPDEYPAEVVVEVVEGKQKKNIKKGGKK